MKLQVCVIIIIVFAYEKMVLNSVGFEVVVFVHRIANCLMSVACFDFGSFMHVKVIQHYIQIHHIRS